MKLMNSDNYLVLNDAGQFLNMFGHKENSEVLMHFLNHILENKGDDFIESVVEILEPCKDPEIALKRQSILDILCREKGGDYSITQVVIVESHQVDSQRFQQQIIEYACGAYLMEARPGGKYEAITKVNCLALLDCRVYLDDPDATFIVSMEVKTPDGQVLKPFTITCKGLQS
jgi:hypothetical protein